MQPNLRSDDVIKNLKRFFFFLNFQVTIDRRRNLFYYGWLLNIFKINITTYNEFYRFLNVLVVEF